MGRASYILKNEDTESLREAVEIYVYDSPWQKFALSLYRKTLRKTWVRVLFAALFLIGGLTHHTFLGAAVLYLSISFFFKLFLVLLVSHLVQGYRWRMAYNDFKRNTGIFHIPLIDFRIMGKRFVRE